MDYEQTVTIALEDGSEIECAVLFTFEAGDEGQEYIAVMPEGDEDDTEVYLYRYAEDENGEPLLDNIESDEEYEIASDAFDEILDEQDFEEMAGDEDDYGDD